MNNILDFQKCSNCGACYNACPTDAISVNGDNLFYELEVDADKCISCSLCKKICPVNSPDNNPKPLSAFGLVHNDCNTLKRSSSGGAFSAIAEYILENDGVVFGAVFSDDFKSVEFASTETRSLDDLRRSKYVESKVGNSFREVKTHLTDGKFVLYCGAPCQIAGLKRYLCKEYGNLITCDFSCGGVPSHYIYSEYLSRIEKKLGAKICDVNFRPKTYGWKTHSMKICASNGRKYNQPASSDPYFSLFVGKYHHSSVREYCLTCDFASNHYADIILADLWKYETISKIRNDNKGISLVIANSSQGEKIIDAISKRGALTVLDLEDASYNLKQKNFSSDVIQRRHNFLKNIENNGFDSVLKHIKLENPLKFKIKCRVKKIIGRE